MEQNAVRDGGKAFCYFFVRKLGKLLFFCQNFSNKNIYTIVGKSSFKTFSKKKKKTVRQIRVFLGITD